MISWAKARACCRSTLVSIEAVNICASVEDAVSGISVKRILREALACSSNAVGVWWAEDRIGNNRTRRATAVYSERDKSIVWAVVVGGKVDERMTGTDVVVDPLVDSSVSNVHRSFICSRTWLRIASMIVERQWSI